MKAEIYVVSSSFTSGQALGVDHGVTVDVDNKSISDSSHETLYIELQITTSQLEEDRMFLLQFCHRPQ